MRAVVVTLLVIFVLCVSFLQFHLREKRTQEPTSCKVYLEYNRLSIMLNRERIALPERCEKYKEQE